MVKLIDLDNKAAKKFFLKPESYFNVKLPPYFNLEKILLHAEEVLKKRKLSNAELKEAKKCEDVNATIFANKDAKYAWRPFQLIHPILYVDLVDTITIDSNWKEIQEKFKFFQQDNRIKCVSIPRATTTNKTDKAEQVLEWWQEFEQEQIRLYLDYEYCIHSDITDCYPSVYTHTIPWALMGKDEAKGERTAGLGNKLDKKICNMQFGQTNGIPQGSVLMDFIAEIILGYADTEFLRKFDTSYEENEYRPDFKILRYRDDYRIFANRLDVIEKIMKLLTETLLNLNLKINSSKTFLCEDLILNAIKPDKLYWMQRSIHFYDNIICKGETIDIQREYKLTKQKHLLQIKLLGDKYRNCGQLTSALVEFYKYRLDNMDKDNEIMDVEQLISIVTSIMVKNPRVIEPCVIILAKLFNYLDDSKKQEIVDKILGKFETLPNTDIVEIWTQRISIIKSREKRYTSKLCRKILNPSEEKLWNSAWIETINQQRNTKKNIIFDEQHFIDESSIGSLTLDTRIEDIDDFAMWDEYYK